MSEKQKYGYKRVQGFTSINFHRATSPQFIMVHLKVGLSPSKFFLIYFNDCPSKMMKNAFYLILKALFVLKIFKFLS